jgi:hypothetical protein
MLELSSALLYYFITHSLYSLGMFGNFALNARAYMPVRQALFS